MGGAAMMRYLWLFVILSLSPPAFAQSDPIATTCGWYQYSKQSTMDACIQTKENTYYILNVTRIVHLEPARWIDYWTGFYCAKKANPNPPQYHDGKCWSQCPAGTEPNGSGKCVQSCPSTHEVINGQCVPQCPVNYDRNTAGQCVRDCTAKQGQPTENGSYQFTGAVSTWSVSGCRVRCPVRTLAAGGGRGDECVYTGASADPNDPPADPDDRPDPDLDPPPEEPDDCLRRGQGYVSGSNGISCVAPSDAPPGNRPVTENDKTDESGSPGPDGKPDPNSPDYKRNDSTAKNNGDGTITENGTETRKGTPDGDGYTCPDGYTKIGDGMCQKQWSKTQDENTFCQQNPKSPLCTGKLNDCEEGTDLARCLRLGKVPEGQEVQEKTIGVSYINPVAVATGGGCPAGIALPKGLGNFNWEPICTFATAIQPIVLVLAWMSAFFIVFGIKDD